MNFLQKSMWLLEVFAWFALAPLLILYLSNIFKLIKHHVEPPHEDELSEIYHSPTERVITYLKDVFYYGSLSSNFMRAMTLILAAMLTIIWLSGLLGLLGH